MTYIYFSPKKHENSVKISELKKAKKNKKLKLNF